MSNLAPPPLAPILTFEVRRPWAAPVTTGALAAVGTVVLAIGNPNTTHVPLCPMRAIGIDCPLCGSLRAVHSLTHLDLMGALDHNLLFTVSVPALVTCYVIWLLRSLGKPVLPGWKLPAATLPFLLVVGLVFAVLRNLPAFAWLGSGTA